MIERSKPLANTVSNKANTPLKFNQRPAKQTLKATTTNPLPNRFPFTKKQPVMNQNNALPSSKARVTDKNQKSHVMPTPSTKGLKVGYRANQAIVFPSSTTNTFNRFNRVLDQHNDPTNSPLINDRTNQGNLESASHRPHNIAIVDGSFKPNSHGSLVQAVIDQQLDEVGIPYTLKTFSGDQYAANPQGITFDDTADALEALVTNANNEGAFDYVNLSWGFYIKPKTLLTVYNRYAKMNQQQRLPANHRQLSPAENRQLVDFFITKPPQTLQALAFDEPPVIRHSLAAFGRSAKSIKQLLSMGTDIFHAGANHTAIEDPLTLLDSYNNQYLGRFQTVGAIKGYTQHSNNNVTMNQIDARHVIFGSPYGVDIYANSTLLLNDQEYSGTSFATPEAIVNTLLKKVKNPVLF